MFISHRRLTQYGPEIELNFVVRKIARDLGPKGAIAFLGAFNLFIVLLLSNIPTALHVLFGAKLGLALIQVKSLQFDSTFNRIFNESPHRTR